LNRKNTINYDDWKLKLLTCGRYILNNGIPVFTEYYTSLIFNCRINKLNCFLLASSGGFKNEKLKEK